MTQNSKKIQSIYSDRLKEIGMSRTQLAAKLNITTLTLSKKISGKVPWFFDEAKLFNNITGLLIICDGDSKTEKIIINE